jgi:hypothetical protein
VALMKTIIIALAFGALFGLAILYYDRWRERP